MMKIYFGVIILVMSNFVFASDGDNIKACVNAASSFAGVKLDSFSAVYEGRRIMMSKVKWPNAECEVKLGHVYNLKIDDVHVVFKEYAGKKAYVKSEEINFLHNSAIQSLKTRIAILEQNNKDVDDLLKKPNPDLDELLKSVNLTIDRALAR